MSKHLLFKTLWSISLLSSFLFFSCRERQKNHRIEDGLENLSIQRQFDSLLIENKLEKLTFHRELERLLEYKPIQYSVLNNSVSFNVYSQDIKPIEENPELLEEYKALSLFDDRRVLRIFTNKNSVYDRHFYWIEVSFLFIDNMPNIDAVFVHDRIEVAKHEGHKIMKFETKKDSFSLTEYLVLQDTMWYQYSIDKFCDNYCFSFRIVKVDNISAINFEEMNLIQNSIEFTEPKLLLSQLSLLENNFILKTKCQSNIVKFLVGNAPKN